MITFKIKQTTFTIEGNLLLSSRLLNSRMYKVTTNLDGTVSDMGTKANRLANLDNEVYKDFARIQKEVERCETPSS